MYRSLATFFYVIVVLNFSGVLFAQRVTYDTPDVVGLDHKTGKILVGPDANNITQLFNLLRSSEVTEALDLNKAQKIAIENAFKSEKEKIRELYSQKVPFNEITGALRSDARSFYDEVLTPAQKLRMRQVVFRIEVSVIGLAAALTEGRLRDEVKVYENQVTRIQDRGKEIEARTKAEILAILKRSEKELLAELTPEQRAAAEKSLGDFFVYSNVKAMQELREELKANKDGKGVDRK